MQWNLIITKELKPHYISSKAFESAINDIIERHDITFVRLSKVFNLKLDSGGPVNLLGDIKFRSFDFGDVSISEEHIKRVSSRIDKIRHINNDIIKIYVGPEQCVVLTNSEYELLTLFVRS